MWLLGSAAAKSGGGARAPGRGSSCARGGGGFGAAGSSTQPSSVRRKGGQRPLPPGAMHARAPSTALACSSAKHSSNIAPRGRASRSAGRLERSRGGACSGFAASSRSGRVCRSSRSECKTKTREEQPDLFPSLLGHLTTSNETRQSRLSGSHISLPGLQHAIRRRTKQHLFASRGRPPSTTEPPSKIRAPAAQQTRNKRYGTRRAKAVPQSLRRMHTLLHALCMDNNRKTTSAMLC